MRTLMRFVKKYPLALNELLLAPVVFRENLPALDGLPEASAAGMKDLASFAGFADGAIRTAMSRLRSSGLVTVKEDAAGIGRYRMAGMAKSISQTVLARPNRPEGFLLAIFSFSAEDVRERQVVRDALKLHGFQKLAQNVYINGPIDTAGLEKLLKDEGLAANVFLFRCADVEDPLLRSKLTAVFDLAARKVLLTQFEADLRAWLEEPKLDDATFARRFFYAGPVHYRLTFTDEPPVPARYLPDGYPLERVAGAMGALATKHAKALSRYFRTTHV